LGNFSIDLEKAGKENIKEYFSGFKSEISHQKQRNYRTALRESLTSSKARTIGNFGEGT
jgi:hypothetical protein